MRRTKEAAARTRAAVVESALGCFERHGIANATLGQIARGARVTKGAVYHHFAGKREIFHEIREQVAVPLLDEADTTLLSERGVPALARVERFLASLLATIEADARKRRALHVMQFKCEYADGLAGELEAMMRNSDRLVKAFEGAYRDARRQRTLAAAFTPRLAALDTAMFLSGLLRLWLLHTPGHPLRRHARAAIRAHVRARRAAHEESPR
jgi:TetR/AcrR family acrAB operon transcriptional repressor